MSWHHAHLDRGHLEHLLSLRCQTRRLRSVPQSTSSLVTRRARRANHIYRARRTPRASCDGCATAMCCSKSTKVPTGLGSRSRRVTLEPRENTYPHQYVWKAIWTWDSLWMRTAKKSSRFYNRITVSEFWCWERAYKSGDIERRVIN